MRTAACAAALSLVLAGAASGGRSVTYAPRSAAGTTVNVVTADLNDPKVKVVPTLAAGWGSQGCACDEDFGAMMKRLQPVAAINGTFFDKYTLIPVGSIVFEGDLIHAGGIGTAFCLKTDGSIEFRQISGTNGTRVDWSGVDFALCCGPTLLIDGKSVLDPTSEGFSDPHVFARANRSALGVTASKKLLLVTMPRGVTLEGEAKVMKELGAVNAINLDGGASSAMYYRGKFVNRAGRKLTNVLLVYENGTYPREKMQCSRATMGASTGQYATAPAGQFAMTPQKKKEMEKAVADMERLSKVMTRYRDRPIDIARYSNAEWSEAIAGQDGKWFASAKVKGTFDQAVAFYRAEIRKLGWKAEFSSSTSKQLNMKMAGWVFSRKTGATGVAIMEELNDGVKEVGITVSGCK